MFIVFCAFPLFTYFKDSIFWTLLCILDNIHHIRLYTVHIFNTLFRLYTILKKLWQFQIYDNQFQQPGTQSVLTQITPPLDEFVTEVREQLTVFPSVEQTQPIQEIQQEHCEPQVFEAEQDLTFLQSSSIPSTFNNISNTDGASSKIRESHTQTALPSIQLPTRIPQEQGTSPPTQTVEPVLGFTPAEIHRAQAKSKLTVEQLLEIELCQEYVKTPLLTLDGIHVHQPKRFLLLAKEAKKLAEAFKKEQDTSQWASIPHEKLLHDSFVEQLNSLQTLEQLAPLKAAKEHLPKDIINILELSGMADNIPFNQLYSLAEDCTDRYKTKVIKTLTQLLNNSFNDRQLVLVNMARALKFLESYGNRQTKIWKVLSKYDRLPDHFHNLQTTLQTEFNLLKKATSKNIKIYMMLSVSNKPILHLSAATLTPSLQNWLS